MADSVALHLTTAAAAAPAHRSAYRDFVVALLRTSSGRIGTAIIVMVVLVALSAPIVAPFSPLAVDPPDRLQAPSSAHLMGTDELGRDVLSRVLYGSQISLQVGIVSVSIAVILGVLIGLCAGFYGSRVDLLLMRVVDVMQAFPGFLLALAIVAMLGPSLPNAMIAVGIGEAPGYARMVRGSVLSIKNQDYVVAARVLGASNVRIVRSAVLPNVLAPSSCWPRLASLSRCSPRPRSHSSGLVPSRRLEWGAMIVSGRNFITNAPWLINFPGLAIFVTVLGFNLFGNAVRDALDPRLRQR
jgi:peptide/nickel transport system permease protein